MSYTEKMRSQQFLMSSLENTYEQVHPKSQRLPSPSQLGPSKCMKKFPPVASANS